MGPKKTEPGITVLLAVVVICLTGCEAKPAIHETTSLDQQAEKKRASEERVVTISGTNGVSLAGTLLLPTRRAGEKVPAAIIVAGSGPTDRNGNQPGLTTNLLKVIAVALQQEGIASLRYDKRGQYESESAPADSLATFTAWQNYVGDSTAALKWLQALPEVDARRIAMIGHSEGGLIVLQSAVEAMETDAPEAIVLLSTPGRRCDFVLRDQISGRLRKLKTNRQFSESMIKKNNAIMESILKTGTVPDDVPVGLVGLYPSYLGNFLQSLLSIEGASFAKRLSGPVLVMSGEKDLQHNVALESATLGNALARRKEDDHEVFIVTSASHNLTLVTSDNDHGFGNQVSPEAVSKLRTWLGNQLKTKGAK